MQNPGYATAVLGIYIGYHVSRLVKTKRCFCHLLILLSLSRTTYRSPGTCRSVDHNSHIKHLQSAMHRVFSQVNTHYEATTPNLPALRNATMLCAILLVLNSICDSTLYCECAVCYGAWHIAHMHRYVKHKHVIKHCSAWQQCVMVHIYYIVHTQLCKCKNIT